MPVGKWIKALSLDLSATLRKLSLRHCRIGDEGCKAMRCSGLTTCLKEIDLTGCAIADAGAVDLASLLASQSFRRVIDPDFGGLQKVVLNYNEIGNRGYSKLIDVILNDYWIKSVELRSCKISTPCDALRLALVNKEIEVFDLRDNPMPSKAIVEEIMRILVTRHPKEISTYTWRE
uniref:Centrosomal protein of 78 kDa n=1 Tax=Lygus hesperus TaxID=30085 RepID=A0A0A9XT93_LYGHE